MTKAAQPKSNIVAAAEALYEAQRVQMIFAGIDGKATLALYDELTGYGHVGRLAVAFLRAQKSAERAKLFPNGRHYAVLAASRRTWALEQLIAILGEPETAALGVRSGWVCDLTAPARPWVLVADLPTGQVAFHATVKGFGPAYAGQWDGADDNAARIIAYANVVLHPSTIQPESIEHERVPTNKKRRTRGRGPRRRVSRKKPGRRTGVRTRRS